MDEERRSDQVKNPEQPVYERPVGGFDRPAEAAAGMARRKT
jgi:hypothetical protein